MKQKLQDYAFISEIIGGLAIIASLIFVGIEVRQNNAIARTDAYQRNQQILIDMRHQILESGLAGTFLRNITGNENIEDSVAELFLVGQVAMIAYEQAYVSNKNGIMDAENWARFDVRICAQWEDNVNFSTFDEIPYQFRTRYLSPDFLAYAREKCE